ncbi:MAG: hypothetical protein JWN08_1740 [Frankiales bacterium]|nr:hypothetical protein [Frankiales bacterium]
MQVLGFDDDDRAFLALPAAALALATALVLGLGLGFVLDRSSAAAVPADSPAAAESTEPQGCVAAVDRAVEALAVAREVDVALSAHTDVLNDLRARRVTPEQALQLSAPLLTEGAERSVELDVLTQRFEQVASGCRG